MPDFWFDSDSLITPSRGPYRFNTVPRFWEFLEDQARQGIIASSEQVFYELAEYGDELAAWAKKQRGTFFLAPGEDVQVAFRRVVDFVKDCLMYSHHQIDYFLRGADPWVVAHAVALGGRIVTFEKPEPSAKKPKIPDVAAQFDVACINLYDFLSHLNWRAS